MNYEQKHPILQKLEEYFKNTPKEQIDKDWSNILKATNSEAYYEKKYQNALGKVKWLLKDQEMALHAREKLANVFPELQESENEQIKKEIIDFLELPHPQFVGKRDHEKWIAWLEKQKNTSDKEYVFRPVAGDTIEKAAEQAVELDGKVVLAFNGFYTPVYGKTFDEILTEYDHWLTREEALAWLEKQGKKKNPDDNKPKFKAGDWVVSNNDGEVWQIGVRYTEEGQRIYLYNSNDVIYNANDVMMPITLDELNNDYHLWSINDAKNGDVLFHSDSASNGIFIFKEILQHVTMQEVICYCDYDSEDGFCLGEKHTCCWTDSKILHPATKKQRDLLENAITGAGYKWNAKKKELKKLNYD